ncbi:hypothetical protein ACQEVF_25370 [Nonomuraea polychroma]|uniref:hypothetical protein n=1 Tax=Nonomuraea polychroma TaxID=46176 RepID=UPI003D940CA8
MANEVEIVISTKDRSGPGLAAVRTRARQFGADLGQTMAKAGQHAGQQLGEGIVRGADGRLRDARGRFVKGGQDLGDGIADGIKDGTERGGRIVSGFAGNTLRIFSRLGPGMGAAVTAGLFGAAASAGTVAGAITLAVGGAITGIGVVSAAQSQRVRSEWQDTGRDLKASLADAAAPLEASAIRAATVTRTTFGRLKPFLADFFARSAPAVDRFVASIGDGVASLGPALQPLQRGFSAVLDAIGARSPAIFGALQRSFENLGRTAEKHADDIAFVFEFAADKVEALTEAVEFLADKWEALNGNIGITPEVVEKLNAELRAADPAFAKKIEDAAGATSGLGSSARDASAGLRDLRAELENLNGPALDAAEAQIRVEEAIDRATEALRKNGRTLNVNTEKGRANKEALIDIARAAQQHIAAMQAERKPVEEIAEKYGQYRNQLIRAGRQASLTKEQAEKLADAWMKTPEEIVTHAKANVSDLEAKIADAKRKLRDPKLTRPERSKLRGDLADLRAKIAEARALLRALHGDTATVYIQTVRTGGGVSTYSAGGVRASSNAHGGIIGGIGARRFQTGGVSGSGSSLALVGEQGPELVRLPFGSGVTPAGQTRAMMGGGGFGSISMAFRSAGRSASDSLSGLGSSLREVLSFREALDKLTGSIFGQERALGSYEAAWDAARRSLKENGKTLSLTREKGRENRSALLGLAEAAHEVVIAMEEMGRSNKSIIAKMREQRREFIRMARSMGLSKSKASAMADRFGLTTSAVRSALAGGKASGGVAGGMTLVGERGPELVRLPFGSSVTPAGQTAAMLAGGGGGALTVVLEVRGGQSEFDRFMAAWIRQFVHAKGGNVQVAFGRS